MKIYLLAGHTPKGPRPDPGASGNGLVEAIETVKVRDRVTAILRGRGFEVINDDDTDRLQTVLDKIPSTYQDIICDIHFNAFHLARATGAEVIIPDGYTPEEMRKATALSNGISKALGIANRGVKPESRTARGRLAVMKKKGINLLIEVCFLTNPDDVASYKKNFEALCVAIADGLAD